ncbi:hypothetical protein OKHIL_19230 [Mycolicibacterium mageritense]
MNSDVFLDSFPRTPTNLFLGGCPFLGGFVAFAGGSVASHTQDLGVFTVGTAGATLRFGLGVVVELGAVRRDLVAFTRSAFLPEDPLGAVRVFAAQVAVRALRYPVRGDVILDFRCDVLAVGGGFRLSGVGNWQVGAGWTVVDEN